MTDTKSVTRLWDGSTGLQPESSHSVDLSLGLANKELPPLNFQQHEESARPKRKSYSAVLYLMPGEQTRECCNNLPCRVITNQQANLLGRQGMTDFAAKIDAEFL